VVFTFYAVNQMCSRRPPWSSPKHRTAKPRNAHRRAGAGARTERAKALIGHASGVAETMPDRTLDDSRMITSGAATTPLGRIPSSNTSSTRQRTPARGRRARHPELPPATSRTARTRGGRARPCRSRSGAVTSDQVTGDLSPARVTRLSLRVILGAPEPQLERRSRASLVWAQHQVRTDERHGSATC
jgi:hypothetical protein